jgi:RsiW-degrading membrane proteinase PrsW (M82 family)
LAVGSATLLATLSVAGIAGFAALPLAIGVIAQVADLRVGFLLVPGALLTAAAVLRSASATMRPIGSP